ncbi:MAG: efflux RND transporter permease subunit [Elusimicrobia bacterium]|nr:efflux RND transporter permease subunit [Candidatus Obscuribacterium magneticum]
MNLTRVSINRPIATLMIVVGVCLGGFISMFNLPVDLMPNVESNLVTIFVGVRGGMPPEDIEHLITVPIEQAMATMENLESVLSVSRKDRSTITLEFKNSKNIRRAPLEVSERLARIKGKLPKEIEKPIVARYNENDHPVVILSATSSVKTPEILRQMIEKDLKPQLSRIDGVANIEIGGGRQRKILVEFEKAKLEMHRLPVLEVINQLGQSNVRLMSGKMEGRRDAWTVPVEGSFRSLDEMKELGVSLTKEGSFVRLKDIAVVRDYYMEPESYARVNNQPSVSVYIQKEAGANTIKTAREILKLLNEVQKSLSSDIGFGVTLDQSVGIRQAIADVRRALTEGAFLTALVLWFFLRRLRQVGVIILSIPVAVLGTFFAMLLFRLLSDKMGVGAMITINVMSLLGIALGIGRMVDDSIVVFENILHRFQRSSVIPTQPVIPAKAGIQVVIPTQVGIQSGVHVLDPDLRRDDGSRRDDVIAATREMALAVGSSTLILMVIFLPIVFFSEDIRKQFTDVAFTVVVALSASLLMAITVVPLLTLRSKGEGEGVKSRHATLDNVACRDLTPSADQYRWERKLIEKYHEKCDPWILGHRPYRWYLWMTFYLSAGVALAVVAWKVFDIKHHIGLFWLFFFLPFGPLLLAVMKGQFSGLLRYATAWGLRHRGRVMAGVAMSLALTVVFYIRLPKEFIGSSEKNEFVIFVELPSGTKLDVSDKVVSAVEADINALPEVKNVLKTVSARVEGWSSKIYVTLTPAAERTRTAQDVIDDLRPRLKSIGAEYDAFIYFSEPESAKEIIIDVFGKDYLALRDLAVDIAKRMQEIKDLRDVKLRYKSGRPEIRLEVDHARASLFGFSSKYIADSLHAMVRGLRATYFNAGSEQVETVARLSEEDRRTLEHIGNLTLVSPTKGHNLVPISQVLNFENGLTPSEVWRRDKERVIQVSANRERLALSTTVERIMKALRGLHVPIGYYYEFGGDYKKLVKSEREFFLAFIVMLALVYMVLACFFESYSQPLLMLLTIPLATAGSMPMLWATKTSINMGVYIGLLMLGGTVVSNAIIIIDRLNAVRATRGVLRSVLKVGTERSRPIFMTSLSTIAAMLPLTFSRGESADMWVPLALTVVSGIALSSVLTLVVIPTAYVILDGVLSSSRRKSGSSS